MVMRPTPQPYSTQVPVSEWPCRRSVLTICSPSCSPDAQNSPIVCPSRCGRNCALVSTEKCGRDSPRCSQAALIFARQACSSSGVASVSTSMGRISRDMRPMGSPRKRCLRSNSREEIKISARCCSSRALLCKRMDSSDSGSRPRKKRKPQSTASLVTGMLELLHGRSDLTGIFRDWSNLRRVSGGASLHAREEPLPLRQDLLGHIARPDRLPELPEPRLHSGCIRRVEYALRGLDQTGCRVGIEVIGCIRVHLAMDGDVGSQHHAAAAHCFDPGEIKTLAEARTEGGGGVPVEHAQVRRGNCVQHEEVAAVDPRPEALDELLVVPSERAHDHQLQVGVHLRLQHFPGGNQARVVLAWLDRRYRQQVLQGSGTPSALVEPLLL